MARDIVIRSICVFPFRRYIYTHTKPQPREEAGGILIRLRISNFLINSTQQLLIIDLMGNLFPTFVCIYYICYICPLEAIFDMRASDALTVVYFPMRSCNDRIYMIAMRFVILGKEDIARSREMPLEIQGSRGI